MTEVPRAPRRPTLLVILDGFGINPDPTNNAVMLANTPSFDRYFDAYPMTTLEASGRGVGLPAGQMGNSEVGHMTIGCGSIVKQDLVRIDDAIEDGSFFENPALLDAVNAAREAGRPLHLAGLVSEGGVHSHIDHLQALIRLCQRHQVVPQVHMITDGRDTAPQAALSCLPDLEALLRDCGGRIATISGRYYAMDRDRRWERVRLAWDNIVHATGIEAESAQQAIQQSYDAGRGDEFILPTRLPGQQPLQAGDEMIFFNFRNDRARQICAAFALEQFDDFPRGPDYRPIRVTTMTYYDDRLGAPIAFAPTRPETTLGGVISEAGLRQLHCAETEKYAHVTFFFNGGRESPYPGEDRKLIDSPRVATYDLQPEMSAPAVADAVVAALQSGNYEFIVVNFANGDMVGHTAVRAAVIEAVEALDREVGRVLDAAIANDFAVVLTADHGNCDEMVDPVSGEPHTQHSNHPVPCLVIDAATSKLAQGENLSAIAPTVLQLMGLEKPPGMTGRSVILDSWSELP
ncbi:MAG: 2,3-bisphosphoglycerate-independent phosphoglycerate mutase [Gammaproteobacteria bacterium]|nr:2,3-bisphosphoglycerate-independent phosphoglycerate mutase [Gammaproteobacteria bacterium]MDH3448719.1 2,3-bisphosphoglycerate-independent phosphoglycerate mutase [Gammaproteobacteria bacterium]